MMFNKCFLGALAYLSFQENHLLVPASKCDPILASMQVTRLLHVAA